MPGKLLALVVQEVLLLATIESYTDCATRTGKISVLHERSIATYHQYKGSNRSGEQQTVKSRSTIEAP